jgi:NADPH:quinone reductase-like Zn-dependent oxidoreductase
MSRAMQITAYGGPEQMQLVDLPVGEPGPGDIRIRHHASGLNGIGVYQRKSLYASPLPLTLGMEGAGVVEAVGEGVTHLKAGDRAAKCERAKAHGAAHVIDCSKEDFVARVKDITGGKGVKVVYDSVGKDSWEGSLYVTRQTLFTHIASRQANQEMADGLFGVVLSGAVKIRIDQRYPLADVAQAHRDLEARKTTGSTILMI